MPSACCVRGCETRSRNNVPGVSLHCWPDRCKQNEKFHIWRKAVKKHNGVNWEPDKNLLKSRSLRICSRHFTKDQFDPFPLYRKTKNTNRDFVEPIQKIVQDALVDVTQTEAVKAISEEDFGDQECQRNASKMENLYLLVAGPKRVVEYTLDKKPGYHIKAISKAMTKVDKLIAMEKAKGRRPPEPRPKLDKSAEAAAIARAQIDQMLEESRAKRTGIPPNQNPPKDSRVQLGEEDFETEDAKSPHNYKNANATETLVGEVIGDEGAGIKRDSSQVEEAPNTKDRNETADAGRNNTEKGVQEDTEDYTMCGSLKSWAIPSIWPVDKEKLEMERIESLKTKETRKERAKKTGKAKTNLGLNPKSAMKARIKELNKEKAKQKRLLKQKQLQQLQQQLLQQYQWRQQEEEQHQRGQQEEEQQQRDIITLPILKQESIAEINYDVVEEDTDPLEVPEQPQQPHLHNLESEEGQPPQKQSGEDDVVQLSEPQKLPVLPEPMIKLERLDPDLINVLTSRRKTKKATAPKAPQKKRPAPKDDDPGILGFYDFEHDYCKNPCRLKPKQNTPKPEPEVLTRRGEVPDPYAIVERLREKLDSKKREMEALKTEYERLKEEEENSVKVFEGLLEPDQLERMRKKDYRYCGKIGTYKRFSEATYNKALEVWQVLNSGAKYTKLLSLTNFPFPSTKNMRDHFGPRLYKSWNIKNKLGIDIHDPEYREMAEDLGLLVDQPIPKGEVPKKPEVKNRKVKKRGRKTNKGSNKYKSSMNKNKQELKKINEIRAKYGLKPFKRRPHYGNNSDRRPKSTPMWLEELKRAMPKTDIDLPNRVGRSEYYRKKRERLKLATTGKVLRSRSPKKSNKITKVSKLKQQQQQVIQQQQQLYASEPLPGPSYQQQFVQFVPQQQALAPPAKKVKPKKRRGQTSQEMSYAAETEAAIANIPEIIYHHHQPIQFVQQHQPQSQIQFHPQHPIDHHQQQWQSQGNTYPYDPRGITSTINTDEMMSFLSNT